MDSDIRYIFRQTSQPSLVTQPLPVFANSEPNSPTSDSHGSLESSRYTDNRPPRSSASTLHQVHRFSAASSENPSHNPTFTPSITHGLPSESIVSTLAECELLEVLQSVQLQLRRAVLSPRSSSSLTPVFRYVSAMLSRLNLSLIVPNAESALALPLATLHQTIRQLLQAQALNRTLASQLESWRQIHHHRLLTDRERLREFHSLFLFMLGLGRWYTRADLTTVGVSEFIKRMDLAPQGRWTADVLEAALRNRIVVARGGVVVDRDVMTRSDQLCLDSVWQEVRGICTAEASSVLEWWRWARLEGAGIEVLNGGGGIRECMKRTAERVILQQKEKKNVKIAPGLSASLGRHRP